MKKILCSVVFFLFFFSLLGCSKEQEAETDMAPSDIAAMIIESQPELPNLKQITSEEEDFSIWLSDYYLLQDIKVEAGAIGYADGVEASEIAVLLLEDEKDCKKAGEALNAYIQNRVSVFEGYAPQQAALAENGAVETKGKYIALLICPEVSAAKEAFLSSFGGEVVSDSGDEDDTYDSEAVLKAWKTGDDSSLSEINRTILEAAEKVIRSEIDDNMSDYEKELAIHDFITDWSSFDYSVFGRSSQSGFAEGSDTPYGVLIDQSAMCHGYSSAFQLFMDMLDIECITVFGIPGSNGVEHSWNMVKLDDDWYCVDCAWDDPIGGSPGHNYFNVTSDYLRSGSIHRWDEASVPEATGTAFAYSRS